MKHIIFCILFLFPVLLFAQYPSNPIKSRLGWQTTGDGLVYRGSGAPAYSPGTLFNAWTYLDTTNYTLYMYRNFQWAKLPLVNNGLTFDGSYVQLGGTLVENTQIEKSSYTFDIGKISGSNNGYLSFYGTDPYYAGILTTKDGTESGLTIGNKVWGFEVDDSDHVSTLSGTRFGFDATYLGTLGVSQFKMDSTRFYIRGLPTYATHAAADADIDSYGMYQITDGRAIYARTGNSDKVSPNLSDNGTKLQALLPWQFHSWTTAGRPTGVLGYTGFNSTLNYQEFYDGSTWFPTGFWGKTGTDVHYMTGKVGIGTTTPAQEMHIRKGVNAGVQFNVENTTTGTAAWAGYRITTSAGHVGALYKLSAGYTTYKIQQAGDLGFYNGSSGNISILNDVASGNINFASGASSTAQLTIESDGDIFSTGKVGIGITPTEQVDLVKTALGDVRYSVTNNSTGNAASGFVAKNTTGLGYVFKAGTGYTTYKTIVAGDFSTYTNTGNLTFLNDNASGVIRFSAGASATAQMTLATTGNLLLGTTTDVSRRLHISGEARITDLTTDTPTRIVGADADGDLGELGLAGGLSISGGVLTGANIYTADGAITGNRTLTGAFTLDLDPTTVRLYGKYSFPDATPSATIGRTQLMQWMAGLPSFSDRYVTDTIWGNVNLKMDDAENYDFAIGRFANFPNGFGSGTGRTYGLFISPKNLRWGVTGLYNMSNGSIGGLYEAYQGLNGSSFLAFFDLTTTGNTKYNQAKADSSGVSLIVRDFIGSYRFEINTKKDGLYVTYNLSGDNYKFIPNTNPVTGSGLKQNLVWTGDGSTADVAFEYVKKDTTIFVTADTDYDFSAAVTTAQIASRYNRIIIHMTLTSGVGADKTTTLHSPDANLMQCEILIRGTDNTGTYDNEINFGTNNAISSDGTNTSGYTLAQGQGVHVRVVYNGSAYKYIYY